MGGDLSERKADDVLRLDSLAALANALPDAVILVDSDIRLRWGNRAAERLFGMTLAGNVNRSCLDLVHPDDLALAAVSMESVQTKEVGTLLELRVQTATGVKLVEVLGAPFEDCVLLTLRDLTERRRWEIAGNQVDRIRSVTQNAASLTILVKADGTVTAASGALTRLLGHDQEWLEGRPLTELAVLEDQSVLTRAFEVVKRTHGVHPSPVTVDVRLHRRTGRPAPFALTVTNLLDDPTVEGLIVTGHDISDRVAAENELRATNSVLAATLESTTDGILVIDRSRRVTSFNSRFVEMWGLPEGVLRLRDELTVLSPVLDLLVDPQEFVATVHALESNPGGESHDLVEFRDGRVFERDSLPQRIDGEVVGRVWSFRDITDHRALQQELTHLAFHDNLTGLSNKALFLDRLAHSMERHRRESTMNAVLFIDLDDFKTVNDSLGHSTGDELLIAVSHRISGSLRPGDTAARLGGDEFAVLVDPTEDPLDAVTVAQRIQAALAEPIELGTRDITPTASIGIAYSHDGLAPDELLRNADLAMYRSKTSGKNSIEVFADEMHHAALERLDLEARLRGATARGEMVLHYQPIVDLEDGHVTEVEALVRWNHPERGLIGPLSFIPFAEEAGLIGEIGDWVLRTAVTEAAGWAGSFGPDAPGISVNLSAHQLSDPTLADRVEQLLIETGLDPTQLILEITESALMVDPEAATIALGRLRGFGIRLAVDDFGTGYSSLAYLQQFPVDILKIDRTFVKDMLITPRWSLTEAILHLARALDLTPIAEGVEHQAQADALAELGCRFAQGFHFARPADAETCRRAISEALPSRRVSA